MLNKFEFRNGLDYKAINSVALALVMSECDHVPIPGLGLQEEEKLIKVNII